MGDSYFEFQKAAKNVVEKRFHKMVADYVQEHSLELSDMDAAVSTAIHLYTDCGYDDEENAVENAVKQVMAAGQKECEETNDIADGAACTMLKEYDLRLSENRLPFLVELKSIPYHKRELREPQIVCDAIVRMFDADKLTEEHVWLVCMNAATESCGIFEISHGDIAQSIIPTRSIFKRALLCNAAGIIVAHNHTSGNTDPSGKDRKVMQKIKEASEIMDIPVYDFLIIGKDGRYFSQAEESNEKRL